MDRRLNHRTWSVLVRRNINILMPNLHSRADATKRVGVQNIENKSMLLFIFLRQLTAWHYPHLLLRAVLWRGGRWLLSAGRAAIDRYLRPPGPQQQTRSIGLRRSCMGYTNARTPDSFINPLPAYYPGSANKR